MKNIIEITIEKDDLIFDLAKENNLDYCHVKNLTGGTELIEIATYLSPLVIGCVTKIICKSIDSNKNKKVAINGEMIEISGLSEESILTLLKSYIDGK
jgi:hypothetical protein